MYKCEFRWLYSVGMLVVYMGLPLVQYRLDHFNTLVVLTVHVVRASIQGVVRSTATRLPRRAASAGEEARPNYIFGSLPYTGIVGSMVTLYAYGANRGLRSTRACH